MVLKAFFDFLRNSSGVGVNGASYTITRLEDNTVIASGSTASDTAPATALLGSFGANEDVLGYPGPIKAVAVGAGGTRTHTSKSVGIVGAWRTIDVTRMWGLHGEGVLAGVESNLAVTTNGTNRVVSVAAGAAVVLINGHGLCYFWPVARTITANAADPSQPRIDTMALRAYPPGVDEEGRIDLVLLAGTPAASPAAPSLHQSTDYREVALANIRVDAGVTAIAIDKVTDRRLWAAVFPSTINPGDIFYADASGKLVALPKGVDGTYLRQGATIPTWDDISADDVLAAVSDTEFAYLDGVTSNIQTQLNAKQPLDTDLTAIAALTSAADKAPYSTGAGTWALTDLTAFARTLIDDANATAAQTTLALVPGTNVQAFDTDLAAIAALTSAADKAPYATGAGTWALTDFTSAGRALVDDVNAAAQRTTLGLAIGTNVQAQSAVLDDLAGLTQATDKVPYFDSSTTAATTTMTAFARTILDDADAATVRATIGVPASGEGQPLDAELTAIAGLVSAADRLPYFTGAGTAALATFTTAGRNLIDDADAAAQRTTIGLGSVDNTSDATKNSASVTLTNKTITRPILTVEDDTSFTIQDSADNTKQMRFQLAGIATGNTRTITIPDSTSTMVLTGATQTLSNKTLTDPTLSGDFQGALSATTDITAGDDLVATDDIYCGDIIFFGTPAAPTIQILTGGSGPESVYTAPPGSLFLKTTGQLYVKQSGTGNTGWVLK